MSETLRDLVVSLSLNSDNFTRNIKSVGKHIQQAESEFKLAAAGVQRFEKSTAGLNAKVSTLKQKLDLQKVAVEQYQKALAQAEQRLATCKQTHASYAQKLTDAKNKQAELKQEVKQAKETFEKYKETLGDNNETTIEAYLEVGKLEKAYEKASEEVKKLQNTQVTQKKSIQNASDAVAQANTNLNNAKATVKELTRELTTLSSSWTKVGMVMENVGSKLTKEGKAIAGVGKTLTTAVTTPIAALGAASVKASIDFESSFAGVRKTVDATEEEYAKLADASKKMSTQIATSTNEINGVMATGGQLGIANNYLAGFTRTMIDLGNSCEDLNANDAATQLAKFANIMHTDQSLFQNMGSTVVDLGNNFATTERPIVEMAMRLAGAGKQVGLTEAQVLGFATALSSVGIEAQMGGSAFSKALINMEVAAQTGGQALTDFAKVSGMTEDAFKRLFETDPAAAFQSFIVGLSKMDDEGESAIVTLNDIGISEIRLRDTLLRATNATELFSRAQETATRAWTENTALAEEAAERYGTTESKLKNLKNTAVLFGKQVGDDLKPTIKNLADGATDLLNKLLEMDDAQRTQIVRFAGVAAAAGPLLTAYGKVTGGIGKASTAIGKFMTSVGKAGGGFKGLMSVVKSSPTFWFAMGTAVIAGSAALIDYASGAKQAREAMEGMQRTADKWKNTAAETFYGKSGGLSFFGLSKEDFIKSGEEATATSQEWLDGLLEVWSDGKSETNAIVNQWTDSWKALSAGTRAGMAELQKSANASGNTSLSAQLQADLDTLDSLDKELAALLKKRQNKLLTDGDKVRLQELIDTREALEVKYSLTPATDGAEGFDGIRQKLQAEVARAQALGKDDADASVYENATVAAAQGLAAVNDQIDAQYDKEFALIQLMEDGAAKDAARAALDKKYSADRNAAAKEYAAFLSEVTPKVYGQEDIQKAKSDLEALSALLSGGAKDDPALLTKVQELTAGMDETAVTEYLGLLTQIQSLMRDGMTEGEVNQLFPEIDVSKDLDGYAALVQYLNDYKTLLPGLHEMFAEAVPEELQEITVTLNLDGAAAAWKEFAQNPGEITTEAIITGYSEDPNAKCPTPKAKVALMGYEADTYRKFVEDHPVKVNGVVHVSDIAPDVSDLEGMEGVNIWEDGMKLPVNPYVLSKVKPTDVVVLDEDGTMHVIITPQIQGTTEAVQKAGKAREENFITASGPLGSSQYTGILANLPGLGSSLDTWMQTYTRELKDYREKVQGTWRDYNVFGHTPLSDFNQRASEQFTPDQITGLKTFVSEAVAAIKNGQEISDEDMAHLQSIADFLSELSATGADKSTEVGTDITAGVAQAMTDAGWDATAETVATDIETALRTALDSHSPARRMLPIGADTAAGVGQGMAEYDPSADAQALATTLAAALSSALNASVLRPIGFNAMAGLAVGIRAGQSSAIAAMRTAARASVNAAKAELQIHSPSRVFKDEVGRMAMKGLGVGYLEESKRQAAVIRNASRYLTGEAKSGAIVSNQNDNRRTYNQNSSVNLTVQSLQVRDEQDVRSLAVEIASLTRQQQRGKGLRMA